VQHVSKNCALHLWLGVRPFACRHCPRAGPITPELPQANSPVTLVAASDPVTGKSEFRYRGTKIRRFIRVQPEILNPEYKNGCRRIERECVGHPCMQMTNLHFHGCTSHQCATGRRPDYDGSPGQTFILRRSAALRTPGLNWYRPAPARRELRCRILMGCQELSVVEGSSVTVPKCYTCASDLGAARPCRLPTDAVGGPRGCVVCMEHGFSTPSRSALVQSLRSRAAPDSARACVHSGTKRSIPSTR